MDPRSPIPKSPAELMNYAEVRSEKNEIIVTFKNAHFASRVINELIKEQVPFKFPAASDGTSIQLHIEPAGVKYAFMLGVCVQTARQEVSKTVVMRAAQSPTRMSHLYQLGSSLSNRAQQRKEPEDTQRKHDDIEDDPE